MMGIYCRTSKDYETSIEQQKKIGIEYSLSNNFEYEVYEDEGLSGFKISDDDINPFNNRPSFTSMINDIKNGKITKVWVIHQFRLSRNELASAAIYNIFHKYNIDLHIGNRLLNIKNPEENFMRQIMDAAGQYERHLIVNRTTRGLYNAMDKGRRGYTFFYGYQNDGKNTDGKTKWTPIQSKLDQIEYAYKAILKGASIKRIAVNIYDNFNITHQRLKNYQVQLPKFLAHFEYTGNSFTHEGTVLYQRILKGEIEDINVLNDEKYFVKSVPYPIQIIDIQTWFKVFSILIANKRISKMRRERSYKRASKGIATGIIECSKCHMKFYNWSTSNEKLGMKYLYYKHHAAISSRICKQNPKTYRSAKIDEIFKSFFFFHILVFNNFDDSVNDALLNIKTSINQINEVIAKVDIDINKTDKQINKFHKALDNEDDIATIKSLSKLLSGYEDKLIELKKQKTSNIVELDKLNVKYSGTELEKVYYNLKEVIEEFYSSNNENMRTKLIKIIKKCIAFYNYIIIDTGTILYLFDANNKYEFDVKLLKQLKKDYIYKNYFTEMTGRKEAETYNNKRIANYRLTDKTSSGKNIRNYVKKYLTEQLNIDYDISSHTNLIAFISMRGIYS